MAGDRLSDPLFSAAQVFGPSLAVWMRCRDRQGVSFVKLIRRKHTAILECALVPAKVSVGSEIGEWLALR